jgi:hypothetical protein
MIKQIWSSKTKFREGIFTLAAFFAVVVILSLTIKTISIMLSVFSNYPYLNTCIAIASTIITLVFMGPVFKFTEIVSSYLNDNYDNKQDNCSEKKN